jgi:hypothetical protein
MLRGVVRDGIDYMRRGQAIAAMDPAAYVVAVVVYVIPSLITAYIVATSPKPTSVEHILVLSLPWLTLVIGSVVIMVLVGTHARGHTISVWRATLEGLRWVPRYVWTNAHTTVIFWVPVGLLHLAQSWQETYAPATGTAELVAYGAWWVVISLVAVTLHVRTLLAPFLAVHGGLPASLAVLEAWRLGGRYFWLSLATFAAGVLPIAVPLALAAEGFSFALSDAARAAVWQAEADLIWVGIHAVRPLMVPAVYLLYKDVWHAELARRELEGEVQQPAVVRALLALTRPLPALGRWT